MRRWNGARHLWALLVLSAIGPIFHDDVIVVSS
jgi:hypothetical protein